MSNSKEIVVSISLNNKTFPVGRLWFHEGRSSNRASFEYDKNWLVHPERFSLDPALKLTTGAFHTRPNLSLFGAISDSAPDRWGRSLMRRAQCVKDKLNTLSELDYLLGVNDESRQGALRFSKPGEEARYLASKQEAAIPPLIHLPELLAATERFTEEKESHEDLKLLLAPGSSLGGARPKASIRDKDGSLAIAKFPRKDDEYNLVLWEAVALTLAEKAGIQVPAWRLEYVLNKPILVLQRFDRLKKQRIPFLSSMSMLDAKDNEQHSYLEIAYALLQQGSRPKEDMIELWRRIVFTVMISNTDDHLRNHGFIYERHKGWRLSPVYDVNPTPTHIKPRVLSTAIDFDDTNASLEKALSVVDEFRIPLTLANKIIKEVSTAVNQWQTVAKKVGLSKTECDFMSSAFALIH